MPTKLTTEEWNALTKIAEHSGMDSWFSLREKEDGDFVYDSDYEKIISLEDGLMDFAEGIVDNDIHELGFQKIWNSICDKFLCGAYKV